MLNNGFHKNRWKKEIRAAELTEIDGKTFALTEIHRGLQGGHFYTTYSVHGVTLPGFRLMG